MQRFIHGILLQSFGIVVTRFVLGAKFVLVTRFVLGLSHDKSATIILLAKSDTRANLDWIRVPQFQCNDDIRPSLPFVERYIARRITECLITLGCHMGNIT